jgi:xanthine dehydrogenase YagS FAD-binding subunit
MRPFTFERARDLGQVIAALTSDPDAVLIAGATEMLNWMKEGIAAPTRVIDINALPLGQIELGRDRLRIGALARMSDVAAHAGVRREFPAIAEALELSASPQLRNMASMGGNLLQRTRCPYFRAETALPCNKRAPGTGCAARRGENRTHAIFGWSDACVATHPSDVAVALCALDARVLVRGPDGERAIAMTELYRLPGDQPARETTLVRGEVIVAIDVPRSPAARSSRYLKVRERASYEFALVSAAAAVAMAGDRIGRAQLALGGVAHRPWRLRAAEAALAGQPLEPATLRAALERDFAAARPLEHNAFKIELARRAAVRSLMMAGGRA